MIAPLMVGRFPRFSTERTILTTSLYIKLPAQSNLGSSFAYLFESLDARFASNKEE
jgi:hypothetical protein